MDLSLLDYHCIGGQFGIKRRSCFIFRLAVDRLHVIRFYPNTRCSRWCRSFVLFDFCAVFAVAVNGPDHGWMAIVNFLFILSQRDHHLRLVPLDPGGKEEKCCGGGSGLGRMSKATLICSLDDRAAHNSPVRQRAAERRSKQVHFAGWEYSERIYEC